MGRWGGRDSPHVRAHDARNLRAPGAYGAVFGPGKVDARSDEQLKSDHEKHMAEYKSLGEEGERRKDSKGAYPKDVNKKRDAALKNANIAKQEIEHRDFKKKQGGNGSGSGGGQHHDPSTGQFT